MRGRDRADHDRIITLAHQIEAMAREKRLKPLKKYLSRNTGKRDDNMAVIAMFEALAANGGNVTIRRVDRSR